MTLNIDKVRTGDVFRCPKLGESYYEVISINKLSKKGRDETFIIFDEWKELGFGLHKVARKRFDKDFFNMFIEK